MKIFSSLWMVLLSTACVHTVHSLQVDDAKRSVVDEEVRKLCASGQCSVDRCWMETKNIVFCTIEFSFVVEWHQSEMLSAAAARLQERGLTVGFCGRDSTGTRLLGAFLSGFAAGATSTALGGSSSNGGAIGAAAAASSDSDATSDELNERLSEACLDGVSLAEAASTP